jgi:hypothetical protein
MHDDEPTASERVIATGYDPGNEDSTKPTVYTVVCNVNTSLLAFENYSGPIRGLTW